MVPLPFFIIFIGDKGAAFKKYEPPEPPTSPVQSNTTSERAQDQLYADNNEYTQR